MAPVRELRAEWVLPISAPPIRRGRVRVRGGEILAVGTSEASPGPADGDAVDLGRVALLPGLVNAHTHLELSWMRGAVPMAARMPDWAREIVSQRRLLGAEGVETVRAALTEARATGTVLVGDIGNTPASLLALVSGPVAAVVFRELIGFGPADHSAAVETALRDIAASAPGRVRLTLGAHAPYSVAPALFRAIGSAMRDRRHLPYAVHLAESAEEIEFLRSGTGAWRTLLEDLGAWDPSWTPPGCGPVEYLERLGFIGDRLLVVHGVHLTRAELARLARYGVTLVTCPRSNGWTGAGSPPLDVFHASGVRVAIGTDSLASAPDLSVFAELAAARSLAPGVPPSWLLRAATLNGAHALGLADRYGSLESGKHPGLVVVRVPDGTEDVEEYLVRGIAPADVRVLD